MVCIISLYHGSVLNSHTACLLCSQKLSNIYICNTLDSNWHCTGNQIVLLFPINTEIIFYFGDNDEGHGWLSSGKYSDK